METLNQNASASPRLDGMTEKQRAYWGQGSIQAMPAQNEPVPVQTMPAQAVPAQAMPAQTPPVQTAHLQAAPAQTVPVSNPAPAFQGQAGSASNYETAEQKTASLSNMSATFIVLGLLLIGCAIAPLLSFFKVDVIAKYVIGLAYITLVTITVMWLAGKLFKRTAKRDAYVMRTRIAILVVAELVFLSFTDTCNTFNLRWEITSLILALLLLILQLAPSRLTRWNAYTALRVHELVVIFGLDCFIFFAGSWDNFMYGKFDVVSALLYAGVVVLLVIVVALRTCELFAVRANQKAIQMGQAVPDQLTGSRFKALAHPHASNAAFLVLTALFLTCVVCSYVVAFVPNKVEEYALDIVYLLSALICTIIGFKAESPALRRTGLVVALVAIAKMVLIDTLSYDVLEKAIAYIVGGIVCFALGALYNFAVKKLA